MTHKVAIVISTCLRPSGLNRLLKSLAEQVVPEQYAVRIIVIDNDLTGKNKSVVEKNKENCPYPITFKEEPERGLPYARNTAVNLAWDQDAIIFIDDDEVAAAGWLKNLLEAWQEHDADILTGPFQAILPDAAPLWAIKSNIYSDLRVHKTGEKALFAYGCNTLISQRVFHKVRPLCDPYFSSIGSEDICFSLLAKQQGFEITWCQEALVYDHVLPSRVNFLWFAKRSFNIGNGDALARRRVGQSWWRSSLEITKLAIRRLVYGVAYCLSGAVLLNWQPFITGVRMIIQSVGTVAGLIGIKYYAYKKIHSE